MSQMSKMPSGICPKYLSLKDAFNSFQIKLEVIVDSNVIVYSVRILIVVLALLMGFIHTPKGKKRTSSAKESELIDKSIKPIIEQVK